MRAKLNAVFIPAFGPSALVLDRKWPFRAAAEHGMKLDRVGPAGEAEPQRAQRHEIGPPHCVPGLGAAAIDPLMRDPPLRRPLALDPHRFEVDQRALPRTDDKVLQRRDRDEVGLGVHGYTKLETVFNFSFESIEIFQVKCSIRAYRQRAVHLCRGIFSSLAVVLPPNDIQ